ncbi:MULTISPECIES: amino acid permease [Actinomadura]|uniref:Amino acid permease n=2 Tax=Actinomadura yumaensis TaxID=111807 RepID=A0ABW2CMB2_9ACTN|nr:amino acid permease [Actinomadura sp. J1-007]MWK32798.1 amino acid permease [Actinomadura sp. J1-007]
MGGDSGTSRADGASGAEGAGLRRGLRPRHLRMIALGGIIGAGLFVGSGAVIHTVGPAAVLSYVVGGLLVVFVMRMLGEMASAEPAMGSFMEYARESLGGWAGFTAGWLYWYYWVGIVAFEAVAGAQILQKWVPGVPQWGFALALMLALTVTNLLSVRSFGETEYWLASVKIACIAVFLVVGTLFVLGLWPDASVSVGNIAEDGFVAKGWFAVVHGVVIVIFSYFGAEVVTIAASESREPAKAVAAATVTVVWRVLLFFVGSVLLLVMITPWERIPDEGSPFAAAFDRFGIPAAEQVMNVVVLTAVVSVLNSGLYTASRMLFALREHGWSPSWVGDTGRRGVPWKAIVLSTLLGYVAVVMSFVSPDRVFYFIINSAGAVALFLYGIIALSQLRMRDRLERDAPERLRLKMWLHPWLSWATFACVVLVLASMGLVSETRSQLGLSVVSLAFILAVYAAVTLRAKRTAPPPHA